MPSDPLDLDRVGCLEDHFLELLLFSLVYGGREILFDAPRVILDLRLPLLLFIAQQLQLALLLL